MIVTIISDASFCPDTKVAGYSFWIVCNRGRQGKSGAIKGTVVNNIAAEMMALLNGFHYGCYSGLVNPNDRLILQTDCQAAIDAFEDRRINITPEEIELVQFYKKLRRTAKVAVEFRHVKGHTNNTNSRSFVNRKCDELAGEAMRQERRKQRRNPK